MFYKKNLFLFFIALISLITSYSSSCLAITDTQFSDYVNASEAIGKWLIKSTSHNDFTSASPLSPKRAGSRFMITEMPPMQFASDYGFSMSRAPLDAKVIAAYGVIGTPASALPKYMELNRFHLGFGLGTLNDITASYLMAQDSTLRGWGIGYKRILWRAGPFFFSYRIQYSQSERADFFKQQSISNDFSCSMYLVLLDVYGGVRHTMGKINFNSPIPQLTLPEIKYFSKVDELEYFYGITAALSTRIRLTIQGNKVGDEYSIGAKFSLRFHSLFPQLGSLFVDPRYIKQ